MPLRRLIVAVLALMLSPAPARADWLYTGFIGLTSTGNVLTASTNRTNSTSYGGSVGFMANSVFGFEVDFGYSPDFFSDAGSGSVRTLMGNAILGLPLGLARGYVSGGVGMIRSRVERNGRALVDDNTFGLDIGGGLFFFFSPHLGLRGDLRYFRDLQRDSDSSVGFPFTPGSFSFWRGAGGITLRY